MQILRFYGCRHIHVMQLWETRHMHVILLTRSLLIFCRLKDKITFILIQPFTSNLDPFIWSQWILNNLKETVMHLETIKNHMWTCLHEPLIIKYAWRAICTYLICLSTILMRINSNWSNDHIKIMLKYRRYEDTF